MLKSGSIKKRKIIADIVTYILLSIFSLIILLPILWIIRLSFTTKFVAYKIPPDWFFKPILDNYRSLFVDYGFGRFFFNSLAVFGKVNPFPDSVNIVSPAHRDCLIIEPVIL